MAKNKLPGKASRRRSARRNRVFLGEMRNVMAKALVEQEAFLPNEAAAQVAKMSDAEILKLAKTNELPIDKIAVEDDATEGHGSFEDVMAKVKQFFIDWGPTILKILAAAIPILLML